jgi:hypothetical protein
MSEANNVRRRLALVRLPDSIDVMGMRVLALRGRITSPPRLLPLASPSPSELVFKNGGSV